MSLQFIIGNSGAGKSGTAYENIIREASANPDRLYYVIVPEQFTMQTQKTLVEMHPDGGILNIDILSFERLAYRVFEEVGGDTRRIMEETGKNMVLQKLVQMNQKDLVYLNDYTMYVVEDISGADVDKYHYEINFLPEWGVKVTHED